MKHFAIALFLAAAPSTVRAQGTTAFIDVNVVTMRDDGVLAHQTVITRGGRIAAVGPVDSVVVGADARRVEAKGWFLMPGLMDLHAHYTDENELPLFLRNGVTTVQYLNAIDPVLEARDSVAAGRWTGPTIHAFNGPINRIDSAAVARRVVEQAAKAGYDCIKPYDNLSAEAYSALVSEAHARGLRASAHIPRNLTWEDALNAAPDAIAHAEEFLYSPIPSDAALDSLIHGLVDRHIAVIGTLVTYDYIGRQPLEINSMLKRAELAYYSPVDERIWQPPLNRYVSDAALARTPDRRRLLAFQKKLLKRLLSAGGTVLLGTDAGNNMLLPGYSAQEELQELVSAGFTPYQALSAATSDAGRFLKTDAGTIETGKHADLVLVGGNPLIDISNAGIIRGVMVRGHWLPRDSMDAILNEIRGKYEFERAFIARVLHDGAKPAVAWLDAQRAASHKLIRMRGLNELAYQLLYIDKRPMDAIAVFRANVRQYPASYLTHGSLADGLEQTGNKSAALAEYRAAHRLNSRDRDIAAKVVELSSGH